MHDTISRSGLTPGSPSGPQSGSETDHIAWSAQGSPVISIRRRVMDGICQEVKEAFAAVPRRGAETGGILLGTRDGDNLVIEDFEPVPCEHRFGPSYRLSDTDREALAESLEWFRACAQPGLSVLGHYRSHTLPDFALSEDDKELMRTHFSEPENVFLLIKPNRIGPAVADFFVRRNGRAEEASTPTPFPFTGVAAVAPVAWPPPRPRLVEETEERAPKNRRVWYVAATVLGLAGGALGYLSLQPTVQSTVHRETGAAQAAARNVPPVAPPAAPATTPPASEQQAAQPVDSAGIQALLDDWSTALKSGDYQAASAFYAPLVSVYFSRHDVNREAVRQSIRRSLTKSGSLDVFRISDLEITPVGDDRAVVAFLKHWQASGPRKAAGTERERMTLTRIQGVWQIVAEQQDKSYDKRKPRRASLRNPPSGADSTLASS